MTILNKKHLKGGSLSSTYLITDENGSFVRKEVSLIENREYGFQRWYSQLKRMQRYDVMFPGVFPKILKYGFFDETAYFDMEFIENSITAHEFLISTNDQDKIDKFLQELIVVMKKMHHHKISSNSEAIYLYILEEVDRKIQDCLKNKKFINFMKYDYLYFNGEKIPSFMSQIDNYKQLFSDYLNPIETFTHGNLTLENILYVEKDNRVIFIDPYEENIIDSILCEYSQIYQSSNSKYEIYNSNKSVIKNNIINIDIPDYDGLNYFNQEFTNFVKKSCDEKQFKIIKLLEISQYARMLPFKMVIDENKMIFFYGLASKLFNDFLKDNQ